MLEIVNESLNNVVCPPYFYHQSVIEGPFQIDYIQWILLSGCCKKQLQSLRAQTKKTYTQKPKQQPISQSKSTFSQRFLEKTSRSFSGVLSSLRRFFTLFVVKMDNSKMQEAVRAVLEKRCTFDEAAAEFGVPWSLPVTTGHFLVVL